MSTTYYGTAICCDTAPELGSHNYHSYGGRNDLQGWGFYCTKCHKSASILDNSGPLPKASFAAQHWNRPFQPEGGDLDIKTSAPPGWRWGTLDVEWDWMGGKTEMSFPFILFKTENEYLLKSKCGYECFIDEHRHHRDLRLMNILGQEEDFTWLGEHKRMKAYAYTGASWCTDKTRWYNVRLCLMADRYAYRANPQLINLTGLNLVERRNNRWGW